MLQRRTAWAIVAGVVTLLLGAVSAVVGAPLWITAPVLALVVAAGHRVACRKVVTSEWLATTTARRRSAIVWWLTGAGLVHAAWVAVWPLLPALWMVAAVLLGLPLLAWAEYLISGALAVLPQRAAADHDDAPVALRGSAAEQHAEQHAEQRFRLVLRHAQLEYMQIIRPPEIVSEHVVVFHLLMPSRAAAQIALEEGGDRKRTIAPFGPKSAEAIAIAVRHVTGMRLRVDWVEITQHEGIAGEWRVAITTCDVMAQVRPYVDVPRPRSIAEPVELLTYADGTRGSIPLGAGNGQIIAMSEAGKTNLLLRLAVHVLDCTDAVLLVAGRRKQYETWGILLDRYLDHPEVEIPIEAIANGQRDTVELLYALWLIAQYRQSIPLRERTALPELIVTLDEAADVMADRSVYIQEYTGGPKLTASKLLLMLGRTGKQAKIRFKYAAHQGVVTIMGDEGSGIMASVDWSVVLRTNDPRDIGRVAGDHSLTPLIHQGELYLKLRGQRPRRAKAEYVQEVGKPNAPKTSGTPIDEIGWARRERRTRIDAGSAAVAGEWFGRRHRHMTPDLVDYLRHDPTAEQAQNDHPVDVRQSDAYNEEMRALRAELGIDTTAAGAVVADRGAVAVATRPTQTDRIVELVREHGRLDLDSIIEMLRSDGYEARSRGSISNTLGRLVDGGRLTRDGVGIYREP